MHSMSVVSIFERTVRLGRSSISLFCCCLSLTVFGQAGKRSAFAHPHILVGPGDRTAVLEKIRTQSWAKRAYESLRRQVEPHVARHRNDPEWILSRYLMNRVPGRRYTRAISDAEGTAMVGFAGDAPFPTVRVSTHKRGPVAPDGHGYRMPSLEEMVPYDTSRTMLLQRETDPGIRERVDPGAMIDRFNGRINDLALDAAIVYWLTGDESYARFSADILSQWARGAYHQQPVEGPCRTGFLSIQSIGDGAYEPMPLIYDFLYDWMRRRGYETRWYEPVFQRIAWTMTHRGFWDNNWFAAQTPLMVFATLSIEDRTERARYVDHFMSRDTLSGGCGHLSMPSLLARHFTPDGHWKEPGGYHNFPVSSLLQASLTMERNGHDVFRRYPALFQASHAMLKYSFPDLRAPSIGDTGPTSQSPECLEIGLLFAKRYDTAVYGQLATSLRVLMDKNGYDRSKSGFLGLLCFLPDVSTNAPRPYEWPRSGTLDFAKCYLQRNGTERMHGLMYAVQGASYNHNHANGMAVELYGMGRVMAPDPGKGITYEAPMHVDYYAQWAAHNTVVAGSRSTSVPPVKGGGGTKRIGEIALAAMEPMPEKPAVSEWVSFTDTRYTDISTKARQQRTLAIVRTTDTTGYYVDIYRSDHPASNEYVYHNVGEGSELRKMDGSAMSSISSSIPLHADPYDPPGLRMIDTVRKADAASGIVVFRAGEGRLRALYAPEKGRTLFSGMAPPTKTTSAEYRERRTPVLVWRQEGEAWSRPFVAVYEPHGAASGHSVDSIRLVSPSSSAHRFSAVEVLGNARSGHARQMVLQSTDADSSYAADDWSFRGHFGLIGWRADTLHYLYLGQGWEIGWGPYRLTVPVGVGNASMEVVGGGLRITCPQETVLSVTGFQGGSLRAEGAAVALKVSVDGDGAHITLPAVRGLVLYIGG
ncbi:MAG: hypothetical protein FJX89_07200 [Bacteroidetes bacterium]|nr:hypothetical protein [Bacteroidota bacterium]